MRDRVRIRRVYEPPASEDGYRVLVDRLWPRGLRKDALVLDEWARDLAPSDELRRRYRHDPARWPEFVRLYRAELRAPAARALVEDLVRRAARGPVTLLFAAREERRNNAAVLRSAILARVRRSPTGRRGRPT